MKSYIAALPREEETFLNEGGVLAKTTGTSRTPVREALLRLEAEGFVKRVPHKGAYVPPISDPPDVRAILQARAVVEKWAVSAVETMPDARSTPSSASLTSSRKRGKTQPGSLSWIPNSTP